MERKSIFYADLFVRSGEKDTRHDKNHRSGERRTARGALASRRVQPLAGLSVKMEKSWLFFWYCYNFVYICVVIINFKVITLW